MATESTFFNKQFAPNPLDPSQIVNYQDVQKQMRLAAALRDQASGDIQYDHNGVMSPLQGMAKMLSVYGENKANSKVDDMQLQMAKQKQAADMAEFGLSPDNAGQSQPMGQAGPMSPAGGPSSAATGQPGTMSLTGNKAADYALYLRNPEAYTKQVIESRAPTQDMRNSMGYDTFASDRNKRLSEALKAKNDATNSSLYKVDPNQTVLNLNTNLPIYAGADFKSGTANGFDAYGRPMQGVIAGAPQAQGAMAGATTAAQEAEKIIPTTLPSGAVVPARAGSVAAGLPVQNGGQNLPVGQSTQDKNYQENMGSAMAKKSNDYRDTWSKAADMRSDLSTVRQLNSQASEGALANQFTGLGQLASSLGLPYSDSTPANEMMKSITQKMALQAKSVGGENLMPGALSNQEGSRLEAMVPTLSQTQQGREYIAQYLDRKAERAQAVSELASDYERRNGKLDAGFDSEVRKTFKNAPLFTPDEMNSIYGASKQGQGSTGPQLSDKAKQHLQAAGVQP